MNSLEIIDYLMKLENNVDFLDKVSLILSANMSEQFLKVKDEKDDEFIGKVTSVKLGPGREDDFCVEAAEDKRRYKISEIKEVEIVERIPTSYKYREVYCPICKRKFMWREDSEWMEFYYALNSTGEKARQATCTTCSTKLAVFDGLLEGIDPSDRDDLVHIREYGI